MSVDSEYLDKSSFYKEIESRDDVHIVLETNLSEFLTSRDSSEYQTATVSCRSGDDVFLSAEIEIRSRGITRKSICDFPPVMLKMPKKDVLARGWLEHNNIKLVTHCQDNEGADQLVMREYVSYRLFNTVTDSSFRVKLVHVTYKDINEAVDPIEEVGFLIEPNDEMAQRLGGVITEEEEKIKSINRDQYKKLVVFQYMIGNTDWNLSRRHNIRMVVTDQDESPIPVPYDFDYCGLVNAPYASPHPMLQINTVRERLFQWRGSLEEDFSGVIESFNNQRNAYYSLIQNTAHLEDDSKKDMAAYLDQFYVTLNDEEVFKQEMKKARE